MSKRFCRKKSLLSRQVNINLMIRPFRKTETDRTETICRQLDIQSAQIFKLAENLRNLNYRIDEINSKLNKLFKSFNGDVKFETISLETRTKEAIKLILKRYGRLTSSMLGEILKLSRTRSSEYLKELEREGIIVCKVFNRQKYYMLK